MRRACVRYVSLRTKDRQIAEQIAQEIVPQSLAHVREPIEREIERYLRDYQELRSKNYASTNSCVLKSWAADMLEMGCSCLQEVSTKKLGR